MDTASRNGNRNLAVVRGDVRCGPVVGIEARRKIDRELHGLAVSLPVNRHEKGAQWRYDLRRGRLKTYGTVLRFIDWLIGSGASRETVLRVPELLHWYCLDQLDARDKDTSPKRAA